MCSESLYGLLCPYTDCSVPAPIKILVPMQMFVCRQTVRRPYLKLVSYGTGQSVVCWNGTSFLNGRSASIFTVELRMLTRVVIVWLCVVKCLR